MTQRISFSLRSVFVCIFVVSVACWHVAATLSSRRNYNQVLAEIRADGGQIDDGYSAAPWWWLGARDDFFVATAISFGSGDVTDEDLRPLLQLDGLRTLGIRSSHVGDDGMTYVGTLCTLEDLTIDCPQVTDEGLGRLGSLVNLTELSIISANISPESISCLGACTKIESLQLVAVPANDRSVEIIAATWPRLIKLSLFGTRIRDKAAQYLRRLRNLVELDLRDTDMTTAAVDALAKEIPNAIILYR